MGHQLHQSPQEYGRLEPFDLMLPLVHVGVHLGAFFPKYPRHLKLKSPFFEPHDHCFRWPLESCLNLLKVLNAKPLVELHLLRLSIVWIKLELIRYPVEEPSPQQVNVNALLFGWKVEPRLCDALRSPIDELHLRLSRQTIHHQSQGILEMLTMQQGHCAQTIGGRQFFAVAHPCDSGVRALLATSVSSLGK